MNLHALDIPDHPAELAPWLERQLTGLHLAELVAELSAVHDPHVEKARTLDEVLGSDLPRVLSSGLASLSRSQLRELLREPRLLLDLQERVFIAGGDYWDRLSSASREVEHQLSRDWQAVSHGLETSHAGPPTIPFPGAGADGSNRNVSPEIRRSRWRSWAVTFTAAAAALFIGVFFGDRFRPQPPQVASGWGWQRPESMEPVGTQSEYLNRLADSAEQWFKKRPDTPAALARRIGEFREGCTALLLAEHRPLAPETRDWLRERCRAWAGKLDGHRNDLEAGEDVQKVRAAADETVKKLIQAIRTRATEVAA